MEEGSGASAGEAPETAAEAVTGLFRKPKRNKHTRPRATALDDGVGTGDQGPSVQRAAKAAKPNPLVQSSSGGKQRATIQEELAEDSDRRIAQYDNKATASSQQDTDWKDDAQAQYEQAQRQWQDGGDMSADGSKIYRGAKAYRQYTGKAEDFDSQVMGGHGPARAPVHYRATSRFDYQPDVCKDFRDTGYCGYGDACKFLHDRSDYKTGWQLEKDFEERQKALKHQEALEALGEVAAAPKAGDDLPFACLICREPWHARSNPVVTKCEHYSCESCALKHFQKSRRCFTCGEQTGGIFNQAKNIAEKIRVREEVAAGADMTQEDLLAEYEAAKQKREARNLSGGWAIR